MHVAIDDTYGPNNSNKSAYVTGKRRTHVAVVFQDAIVQDIRRQMRECLREISSVTGREVQEFHFADIYNRKGAWANTLEGLNLKLFEFFAEIYQSYRWRVIVQTVDDRTLHDLKGLDKGLNFDGLNPRDFSDLSLSLLCLRIRLQLKNETEPLTLLIDEGRRKAGTPFGVELFRNWPSGFMGQYASSRMEPLLQIADFFAFCLNRNTHLALKGDKAEIDQWFHNLVAAMRINSNEIAPIFTKGDFSVTQFDEFHRLDRALKKIDG